MDWLEDAENNLNSELEISNDPDKIKLQLSKHKVGIQLQCIYIFNFEAAHLTQCTIKDIKTPYKYCNPLGGS